MMIADRRHTGFLRARTLLWLPVLLALASCGGPSGSDIQATLQEASNALLGPRMAPTIEDVSDVNCRTADGKPGFVCSFRITAVDPFTHARASRVSEGRFVQDNSKWVVMADN